MDSYFITVLLLVIGTLSQVDSYRGEFIPSVPLTGAVRPPPPHMVQQQKQQQQQGCVWSTLNYNNNANKNGTGPTYPPFLQHRSRAFSLDCHVSVSKLDVDFWSTFNRDQLDSTVRLNIKSSIGLEIESGAFQGLLGGRLEDLDISQNNIWAFQDKNLFCSMKHLVKLNVSRNILSDTDFTSSSTSSCAMNIQHFDLSHNSLRRLPSNAFNRVRRVSALFLQNNYLQELEDSTFGGLTQLRLVNMSSNRLVALPPGIFKENPTLRDINVSNNSIAVLSPTIFSGLGALISLDLSHNNLMSTTIRDSIFSGLVRLMVLRLSHNRINYIDSAVFKDLVNLQTLFLDNNGIESISPDAFKSLKLQHLDLSKNRLSVIDSRNFLNLPLRQLYLDHNKIREMDDDSLKTCTNLQDLGLSNNELTEVPVALRSGLKHLVTLDIGENKIERITNDSFYGLSQLYGLRIVDNKLQEIPPHICEHMKNLRVLNVAQNRISKVAPELGCTELRAFRLDNNALEEIPTNLAPQLPSLLWLNVSSNQIKWADYRLLPPTIEWLDLSYNLIETLSGPVSDGGKDTISYSMRVLDISHNLLTSINSLQFPPTLEQLRVNHNKRLKQISPDTFGRSSRLRRVEIMFNPQLESIPLNALRVPSVSSGMPLPAFHIAGNPLVCDCTMEWLKRINQLRSLRQYPKIVDLDSLVCRIPSRPHQLIPLVETAPNDFVCSYKSHCFPLCHCCEFDACDCEMTCPDNCTCFHDAAWSTNIIQCSNSNLTFDIASKIPMDSTEVYLDGNNFPELQSHAFIGRKNLNTLYLNGSEITSIRNKSFNGLQSLHTLHLEHNMLTALNGYEFNEVSQLRNLFLHDNLIDTISKDTFVPLKFLQVLTLNGNRLSVNFPVWTLSENTYLNSITLANNPWSCDCEFLIPYRAWVAAKSSIVVDFSHTTCVPATVGSNDTDIFYGNDPNVQPQLIMNMCDHDKELNFNFNPNDNSNDMSALLESELLNSNHISAEKVASPPSNDMNMLMGTVNSGNNNNHNHIRNYPPINDISSTEETRGKESNDMWPILTSVLITLLIVLLIVVLLVFRKDCHSLVPFWLYSWFSLNAPSCCAGNDDDTELGQSTCNNHHQRGFISSLFSCCCGGDGISKKCNRNRAGGMDDTDKLFDAYFLYSKKDEDLIVQKLAPELESPSSSGYSTNGPLPPPPHHHGVNPCYYRLCLHYRDLCLSAENPLNTDMVLSACDASKRIALVISPSFLQHEMSHPGFCSAIKAAVNKYPNKIIFILISPLTEQNFLTIYPELKGGHFTTMTKGGSLADATSSSKSQITSLEWSDKNFWSKLKLLLPTPTLLNSVSSPSGLNSTSTISSSSTIFNMAPTYHPHHNNLINYNNSLSLHEYAYNTINSQNHQYHRNILPFNPNTPPVPKHHIALSTPAWQQQQQQQLQNQNFYNNSQHGQIIPIPGYPATTLGGGATTPLMMQQPQVPSFNDSFRRYLQQSQSKVMPTPHHHHHLSNCSSQDHPGHHHHHHHQGSHCSSSHSSSTNNNPSIHPYQPLDANYSSASSNEELLDHVYSTLDSPPIMSGSSSNNNNGCESTSEHINKKVIDNCSSNRIDEQDNNANNENSSRVSPPLQNRLNNNNTNCPAANNTSEGTNNNGTMYFV